MFPARHPVRGLFSPRSISILAVVMGGLAAGSGDASAAIINVPGDQPTIQAGINAAVNGDEVVLADGTYTGAGNVNCNFNGKLITVRSASGNAEACIIDCQNASSTRGFSFINAETNAAVLSGITITNGNQGFGGAIFVFGSAAPTISQCDFINNTAFQAGGAIRIITSSGPSTTIRSCRFVGNSGGDGGAVFGANGAAALIINSLFNGNVALSAGGAIWTEGSANFQLVNCTIVGNVADGLFPEQGGGGIWLGSSSTVTVKNSIIMDNVPEQIKKYPPDGLASITVSYSNIEDGWPGVGNITDFASFTDQLGPDNVPGTIDDDLSIRSFSPCADSGDNAAVPAGVLVDLAGNPRFADDPNSPDNGNGTSPLVDMGCYEVQPKVEPPDTCPEDIAPVDGDGVVDVDDLLKILSSWGVCR